MTALTIKINMTKSTGITFESSSPIKNKKGEDALPALFMYAAGQAGLQSHIQGATHVAFMSELCGYWGEAMTWTPISVSWNKKKNAVLLFEQKMRELLKTDVEIVFVSISQKTQKVKDSWNETVLHETSMSDLKAWFNAVESYAAEWAKVNHRPAKDDVKVVDTGIAPPEFVIG